MTQLVEFPEPDPWFLVHRGGSQPSVVMAFDTRAEAEDALCTASVDALLDGRLGSDQLPMTIRSAREMFEDPELRGALDAWEAHVVQLEAETARLMEEQFLGAIPPLLRPGRRSR